MQSTQHGTINADHADHADHEQYYNQDQAHRVEI